MERSERIIILGRDHDTKGEIHLQSLDSPSVAVGTSTGTTEKLNEDAVGVTLLDSALVLAIADGHWGRDASEIGVSRAMEFLDPENPPSTEGGSHKRLSALFEQVNNQLYELAMSSPGATTPETTLIASHVMEAESGKVLCWASFGDSYIFLLRKEKLNQLNSLNQRWLGYFSKLSEKVEARALLMRYLTDDARYVGVASGLELGTEILESGDIIFLCTDGLIGSDHDPSPAVLDEIRMLLTSDRPLASKVETLIASALERGEKDNITCLAALIP